MITESCGVEQGGGRKGLSNAPIQQQQPFYAERLQRRVRVIFLPPSMQPYKYQVLIFWFWFCASWCCCRFFCLGIRRSKLTSSTSNLRSLTSSSSSTESVSSPSLRSPRGDSDSDSSIDAEEYEEKKVSTTLLREKRLWCIIFLLFCMIVGRYGARDKHANSDDWRWMMIDFQL